MENKIIKIVGFSVILNVVILETFTFAISKQYSYLKTGIEVRTEAKYKAKIEKLETKIAELKVKNNEK